MRAGEKSADAVVAKKRGNARGAKGGRNKTKLERRVKGSCEGVRNRRARQQRAPPGEGRGRSGGTAASLEPGIPRRNFAELLTESDVRDSALWLSHAIGSSGLLTRLFQPPDAENRMSGGVGGCRGAIPVTRPDPGSADTRQTFFCKKQFALGMFSVILESLWHSTNRVAYGHISRRYSDSR